MGRSFMVDIEGGVDALQNSQLPDSLIAHYQPTHNSHAEPQQVPRYASRYAVTPIRQHEARTMLSAVAGRSVAGSG